MYSEVRINAKAAKESGFDTDWFFCDESGKVAIVASAGGMLPDSVSSDMVKLQSMIKYFRSLPVLSSEIIEEEIFSEKVAEKSKEQRDQYLKDVRYMVSRGLFYYDKVVLNDFSDFRYYLKAWPKTTFIVDRKSDQMKIFFPPNLIKPNLETIKFFSLNEFF